MCAHVDGSPAALDSRGAQARRICLGLALGLGLGCAPASWLVWQDEGARLAFPNEPEVRHVREGPWAKATVVRARRSGTGYELARFALTREPDSAGRALLLAEIERGLSARPGVRDMSGRDDIFLGRPARRLTLVFDDGAEGRFVVFYRDARTLVELSVFGPAAGIDERAARFFAGYSPRSVSASGAGTADARAGPARWWPRTRSVWSGTAH